MAKKHLFRQLQIKVRQKGLHSFAFYILIFNFSPCLRALRGEKIHEIRVNPWLMNYLCAYKAPFCAFLWLKNPFNQRNLRLINDLHAFGIFTLVEMSLQINLFMQNKANFRKSQMNVNPLITVEYDKKDTWSSGKNEPKTNPNEPKRTQFQKGRNERNVLYNKGIWKYIKLGNL